MYQKSVFREMLTENNEDRRKEAMTISGRGFFFRQERCVWLFY